MQPNNATSSRSTRSFNLQDTYPCPICRNGTVQSMVMMETLSCSFCRHIFSADLSSQVLRVEDTLPKSAWLWHQGRWTTQISRNGDLTALVWFTSAFLICIPVLMIALPAYVFPPIGGLQLNSFSMVWGEITLGIHGLIASWLLAEHYQLPTYVAAKITIDRTIEQLRNRVKSQFSMQQ